jgi:uncharacterized protein
MIVDLSSIQRSATEFAFEVEEGGFDLGDEPARIDGPVSVSGTLTVAEGQVRIDGRIVGSLQLDCTRCLAPVPAPLHIEFTDTFVAPEQMARSTEGEVSAGDLYEDALSGSEIDLADLVREQILLSIPTRIFCREDCKGLCGSCGVNLNTAGCGCEDDGVDPRWQALKNLR